MAHALRVLLFLLLICPPVFSDDTVNTGGVLNRGLLFGDGISSCKARNVNVSSGTLTCNSDGSATVTTGGGGGVGGYVSPPSSATSTCTTGQYSADSSYFYICEATNTWLRTSIVTWAGGGGFLVFRGSKLTFMGSGLQFLGD